MKNLFIALILVLFNSCSSIKNSKLSCAELARTFTALPDYKLMVHEDEKLVSIEIDEECGGIYGIQRIPDSWSFSAIAEGEDYKITILPPEKNSSVKNFRGSPEISTIFRGEWSDCYNLAVTVNLEKDKKLFSRKFRQDFGTGPWVEH